MICEQTTPPSLPQLIVRSIHHHCRSAAAAAGALVHSEYLTSVCTPLPPTAACAIGCDCSGGGDRRRSDAAAQLCSISTRRTSTLASATPREARLTDPTDPRAGITFALKTGGDVCPNLPATQYSVVQTLRCAPNVAAAALTSVVHTSACTLEFIIDSAAACPVSVPFSIGWTIILIGAVVAVAYLCGGSLWKWRVRGASGMEVLPHIELWRAFFANASAGFAVSMRAVGLNRLLGDRDHVHYERQLMHETAEGEL
jgi:hypothetical protein